MAIDDARKVGDIVQLVRGTTYQGALVGKPGPALLGLGSIVPGGGFRNRDFKTYGGECPDKLMLRPNDLFVSLKGATKGGDMIGSIARVPPEVESGRLTQDTVKLVLSTEAEPLRSYLYWLLRTPHYRDYCAGRVTGSAVVAMSRDDFLSYPVPPLSAEGKAIVAVLDHIDDKVEMNRRMNETLEAMGRALFRDWFVDFGPTRAKMAGAASTLSPDLWALFPDHLDDEGKPKGWDEKPLDEIANFLNGLALQKFPSDNEPDSLPVIKIAQLRNGITANSNRASRKVPSQFVIHDGDFLFSWSGSLLAKFWTGGEGALNQHLFKVTSDRYPAWFFSEWVQHHLEEFQLIAASKATTMGHIQRGHLKAAKTICPPDHIIERMGHVMSPLIDRLIINELESRTLAQTRDLLLPRLMSGELRVADLGPSEKETAA
jgi:type I restriction enzyme S subunit